MSLAADTTPELWRTFMPRRYEVEGRTRDDYWCLRIYDALGPDMFAPATELEKWAAVTVRSHDSIPQGMEAYTLQGGRYAVFEHRGPASTFPDTMRHIFASWLPASGYELDHREHFEVLEEGYDPTDPDAREEIWVPIC